MTGCINTEKALIYARSFVGLAARNLASTVSTESITIIPSKNNPTDGWRVVVYDFGIKSSILRYLSELGCHAILVPADTLAEEVVNLDPDAILLSNGPGDPQACFFPLEAIQKLLLYPIPLIGIMFRTPISGFVLRCLYCENEGGAPWR